MYFYLSLAFVVVTIFYMVYGKYKQISTDLQQSSSRHTTDFNQTRVQENKTLVLSSSPPSRNWEHHVFVSFRGEDVREGFLSHLLKEFKRKGINPFIDNEMERGESITPELKRAIKGSRIAIVLLSKKYASSSWCLNELVKIIKCRKKIGQIVITIFYQVEPTDVKKQAGDFGKVFKETCKGKTYEVIQKWRETLAEVATIAGYDSSNWVDEASAIEEVASDVSKKLNHMAPSHYLDRLIGMDAHMKKMQSLLRLDLVDDVRMIGIWGPLGIGKSTICRYLFNQLSNNFQLTTLMVNIKQSYPQLCIDEGSAQLQLQNDMLSKMINHKDIVITDLGAAQDRLKDKKVLLVLDDVDQHAQLVALAEDNRWFGPGSRIIIATEDLRVLLTHGIGFDHIYKVKYPSSDEAFQMFCMYAFRRTFPDNGFAELAREVTYLVGNLPLGLQVMGSYFLRRPKHEWIEALPKLRSRLDGKIESILKFSYDALCDDEYKDLFLHIACFFNFHEVEKVEAYLAESFTNVRQGLQVLTEKSLIYFLEGGYIFMHNLLVKLGQEIVRKQSVCEIGKRKFLVDAKDTSDILTDYTSITKSVIGINYIYMKIEDKLTISERAFEGMSNLQFLRITYSPGSTFTLYSPGCLINIPSKLRLLHWEYSPMTCWPTTMKLEFLVELKMCDSKLEKLWEGINPLPRLKWMNLSNSKNLRELPNISIASSLKELNLSYCSSLVELPSSIGNATNLQKLYLSHCSSLVELPYSIGNAINLQTLDLSHCSSLVELPSSIGNATNLQDLNLSYCSSLVELPYSIGNATNLEELNLSHCSRLVELPCSIWNAINLQKLDLSHCLSLVELPSSIGNATNLQQLYLSDCTNLMELPYSIGNETNLQDLNLRQCSSLVELPCSIGNAINLQTLNLSYCTSLKELPCSIGNATNLQTLHLSYCTSLVELPYSIGNATNLQTLNLSYCTSLKELPFSIGNATNLQTLNLSYCTSFKELPCSIGSATNLKTLNLNHCSSLLEISSSIGNLHKLKRFLLQRCSKLEFLPTNINMERLHCLDLADCLLLKTFPEISTNIKSLYLTGTAVKEFPSTIKSWSRLEELHMSYIERFMEMPHGLDTITKLDLTDSEEIQELGTWIKGFTRLHTLVLNGMRKLVSLPQLPDSLLELDAENCESLERLDCSFCNPDISLNFRNCCKLDQEARDLIIQTSTCGKVILPGGEVPTYFNFKASGNILTVKLNEKEHLSTSRKYRACVLLVNEGVWDYVRLYCGTRYNYKDNTGFNRTYKGSKEETSSENLFIFDIGVEEATSLELVLEFCAKKYNNTTSIKGCNLEIKECGVIQIEEFCLFH